jgi:gliding motility-associated-like protein
LYLALLIGLSLLITDAQAAISCPTDQLRIVDDDCSYAVEDFVLTLGLDDGTLASYTQSPTVGSVLPLSDVEVTIDLEFTDLTSQTCTFNLELSDALPPVIVCPADVAEATDAGSCFATVLLGTPVTSDNCGVASVSNDAPANFPIGETIVTWTVIDNSGNTSTCEQLVTVTDNEVPQIDCPADITTTTDLGSCFATVLLGTPVTSDNCGVATVSNDAPATFPIGTTAVVWTVIDDSGNTSTCEQIVTVTDDEAPEILCPADVAEATDAGSCFATVALGTPATNDNCGVASVSNDAPATFPIGTTTVTWTVIDNAGNETTCEQLVTVTDDEAPQIACPSDITATTDLGSCFATVLLGTPVTSDNCGVASVSNDAPATFSIGTTTVTWTVTDDSGNTSTCEQIVTVTDDEAPQITCPTDINATTDLGSCFATVSLGTPVTSDNCGVASVSNDAPANFPIGTTTVTWTVIDDAGNISTCEQLVTVTDDEAPQITCPSDINATTDLGSCFATVLLGAPVTSDNCGIASISNDAPATFPIGTTTVSWTVTDDAGNETTCEQIVTITDDEAPQIDCPSDINATTDLGSCFATVLLGTPVTIDNFGVASVSNDAPATFPIGTTTVTWTVIDNAGNETICEQIVTVTDDETPQITCPSDINATTDLGSCFATVLLGTPATSDNCGIASVSNDAPANYPIGETIVTWTVTDDAGNNSTCEQMVTVTDDEAPQIDCPSDINATTDLGSCFATVLLGTPVTSDNCGVASVSNDAPATFPIGTTAVVWTVIDDSGNTSTCEQIVTVTDDEAPEIICPADVAEATDAGSCFATVALGTPVTSDNCSVASVSNDAPATFPIGTTTVIWTVIDDSGNTSTCEQIVTVIDEEAPQITCPDDITATTDLGSCFATVLLGTPVTIDNCGVASVSNDAPATFPIGTTTVTWTVIDNAGNETICEQIATVTDDETPQITCPSDINATTDLGSCFATVLLGTPATNDNCGVASVSNDAPATFPIGSTTVIWTVTDDSGNTSTCEQIVTVTDDEAPEITCPADITATTDLGSCFATALLGTPVTSDNCGVASVSNDAPATFPIGTTTVIWTVVDDSGNETTCEQLVTVTDDEDPQITCPADITATTDLGSCFATVLLGAPVTSDNCGIASVSNDAPATFPIGTTTVSWTVTDDAGNETTCEQIVTITDDEAPQITCPADITATTDLGSCFATVLLGTPVTSDNCSVASVSNNAPATFPIGTTTVIWTVIDDSGNTSTCEQIVTVTDDEAPQIDCPSDINATTDLGSCFATVLLGTPVTIDNCGVASVSNDAPAQFPIETTTVTWTVTDDSGNTSTCEQSITVTDDEAPDINCPADITATTDLGSCFATVLLGTPVTSDNCGVASVSNDAPVNFPIGSTTVTWTVIDDSGNTSTCEQLVTITDDEAPQITCPSDINATTDLGSCFATVSLGTTVTSDNCGVASVSNDAPATFPIGTTTVTWTVIDDAGNTSTCEQIVTVTDDEAPQIDCPSDINATTDLGSCFATVPLGTPVTNDNCGVASVSNDAPATFPIGITTVIWTVSDDSGNTSTCEQLVTVTDDEAPDINCPADITATTDLGSCFATVDLGSPVTSDNCGVASVSNDAPAQFPIGTATVTWTVIDDSGNTSTCTQSVFVEDLQAPIVDCPEDLLVTADPGLCSAQITIPPFLAEDNCGVQSIVNDYNVTDDASDVYPVGTTLVNWTITDVHGNASTCVQSITVTDDELPQVACPDDITATADPGLCSAQITIPPFLAEDNCGIQSIVNDFNGTDDASDVYPVETTLVNWTITDVHGNVSTCEQSITVTDDELPQVACPNDITATADPGLCSAEITIPPFLADDNCGIQSIVNDFNGTDDASDVYPVGTTLVNWTITDVHGNVSTCEQSITVTDDELPIIDQSNMGSIGVFFECPYVLPNYLPSFPASDNCAIADYQQIPTAGTSMVSGLHSITLMATDIHGNVASFSFTIEIYDIDPPVLACIGNQTASANDDCVYILEDYTSLLAASDNCSLESVTMVPEAGTWLELGSHEVTVTATDLEGLSTQCSFVINVVDDTAPVVVCSPEPPRLPDQNCMYELEDLTDNLTGTDNCSPFTVLQSPAAGTMLPIGTHIIVLTATDEAGNTSSCPIVLTVQDFESPVIEHPTLIELPSISSCTGIMPDLLDFAEVSIADNCGIANITQTPAAGTNLPVGLHNVTISATDTNGNSDAVSFLVSLSNQSAPDLTCPQDLTVALTDGCTYTLEDLTLLAESSDVCSELVLTMQPEAGTPLGLGIHDILITATNSSGLSSDCIVQVTVEDTAAPEIDCVASVTRFTATNCLYTLEDFASILTITDNCSIASTEQLPAAGTEFTVGEHTITLNVFDEAGNTTSCSFTLVVEKENPLEIVCTTETELFLSATDCTVEAPDYTPQLLNACGDEIITQLEGPAAGDPLTVGDYSYTFEATNSIGEVVSCTFTISVSDTIAPMIECAPSITSCTAEVSFSDPVVTDNCSVTWEQTDATGLSSGDEFPEGITELTFTATDANGLTASCAMTVEILVPTPDFGFTSEEWSACADAGSIDLTTLLNDGGSVILWGGDAEASDVDPAQLGEGTYLITATEEEVACPQSDTLALTIHPLPELSAPDELEVCGDQLTVEVSSNVTSILWDTPSSDLALEPLDWNVAQATTTAFGEHLVTATALTDEGCERSAEIAVVYYEPLTEFSMGEDFEVYTSELITVDLLADAHASLDFEWITGSGDLNWSTSDLNIGGSEEAVLVLAGTASNGICGTLSDTLRIERIIDFMPTAISPNGDGANDQFKVPGIGRFTSVHFLVFDKAGALVFEDKNYDNTWEGTRQDGSPLLAGTYYYQIYLDGTERRSYLMIQRE